MSNSEKLLTILAGLTKKSKEQKVEWREDKRDAGAYYTVFRDGIRVVVRKQYNSVSSDWIRVIVESGGREVLGQTFEDGDPGFEVANGLHAEADNRITGRDGILQKIESELAGDGVIGDYKPLPAPRAPIPPPPRPGLGRR